VEYRSTDSKHNFTNLSALQVTIITAALLWHLSIILFLIFGIYLVVNDAKSARTTTSYLFQKQKVTAVVTARIWKDGALDK
jgi:hypothetical protein